MEDGDEIFEDASEEPAIIVSPRLSSALNNNSICNERSISPSASKLKRFRPKFIRKNRPKTEEIPLAEALEEAKLSVDLFLDNSFEEARTICRWLPKLYSNDIFYFEGTQVGSKICKVPVVISKEIYRADRSIYHALGYGVFMYLKAVMTFEQKHIEEASAVLADACDTINRFRHKVGLAENLGRIVRKVDYDTYTELELHAELCYAECLLLKAALTFCEDETLVSFVKAGLKVRTCYQSFRECWNALHQRDWSNSILRNDFESGVRLGVGSFNLMISLLPGRIMKLLEFIGFDGNRNGKDAGLRELMLVYEDRKGMRHFLACIILLGYHLMLGFFIGSSECDLNLCKLILDEKLEAYPDGAFFKFFKGRYHFVQGEVAESIEWYTKSVDSQDDWPQFHHICYWELYWATMMSQQWRRSIHFADLLLKESKWSRCMYSYQKAAIMCMVEEDLTDEQKKEQKELMENVPAFKQRIAGKSLPMEKFAIRKAERFLAQGNTLQLPALELIYVWNNFRILGKQYHLVESIYVLVENAMKKLAERKATVKFFNDDFCLLNLLQAMCLKYMKSPLQAEECLKTVISYSGKLKYDTYLIPYALFEYALLLRDQGQLSAAMEHLESAKNDFKDYSLLSRLHFRIHAVQNEIRKSSPSRSSKKSSSKSKTGFSGDGSGDPESSSSSFQDVDEILPFSSPSAGGGGSDGGGAGRGGLGGGGDITEEDARKIIQGI